jgi:hypothetical protein
MVTSVATTVDEYLAGLPEDRRQSVEKVRELILANLPDGYEEGIEFGALSYHVPLERYPKTYNKRPLSYVALANQKNYITLYLMCVYGDVESKFREEYGKTGKKLDMGKSCLHFKKVDDLALDFIAREIASCSPDEYIARYEAARSRK